MSSELVAFLRFAVGLPRFLDAPLSASECRRRLVDGLQRREERFVDTVERGIYGTPWSPYRPLLVRAGIELGDICALVRADGVESTLARLSDEGVRVAIEEFKGRRPIVRPGLGYQPSQRDFDNPLLSPARLTMKAGGSRGPARSAIVDLPHLAHEAVYQRLFLDAHELAGRPLAFWRPVPPGRAGLKNAIGFSKLGLATERWFSQSRLAFAPGARKEYLLTWTVLGASRLAGEPIARPEHVPTSRAPEVARWLATTAASGSPALLDTVASAGARVCLAARDEGLDLAGTVFRYGGEPLTEARARLAESVGARAVCNYSTSELGRVAVACADPAADDDVHVCLDKVALIQRERVVGAGARVGSLLFTSIHPSCPKILLNVEVDDYAVLERRGCDCLLGELGLDVHLRGIRSFDKLTSEGMSFLGPELEAVLDDVLPRLFGGGPTDYQLVEEELDGLPRVRVVVSPRVGEVDEEAVIAAVLTELGRGPGYRGMMTGIWLDGGTLGVVRREPYETASAKVLPLHVLAR